MKRLLSLAWCLPPLILPRSLQVARTLDVLRNFGWESDAVTAPPVWRPGQVLDKKLFSYYEERYHRFPVARGVRPWWWRLLPKKGGWAGDPWPAAAEATALELLECHPYDALVTFAQPWSSHLVGLALKRRFPGIPWVAHFSDPWVDSPYYARIPLELRAHWTAQELAVIEEADTVIFTTGRIADRVMAKYPQCCRDKAHVIPHGYAPQLLGPQPPQAARRHPLFVYAGSFYGIRSPKPLFSALAQLQKRLSTSLMPHILCLGATKNRYRIKAWEKGLGRTLHFRSGIGYLACVEVLRQADGLLLVDAPAEENLFLPSKIVDYLMVQRPIIGVTPRNGATADMLGGLGCPCVDPEDGNGLATLLEEGVRRWSEIGRIDRFLPDPQGCLAYHIDHTTAQFAAILDGIV